MIRALVLAGLLGIAAAQTPPEPEPESLASIAHLLPAPGPIPSAEVADARAEAISSQLRCPVCQGLSVQDSPSHSAVAMKGLVHEMVAAGYTDRDIVDFFVSKYGEWVLLEPPAHGLNWMLWVGPVVVLLGGAAWAANSARGERASADPETAEVPDDPYARKLLAALDDED